MNKKKEFNFDNFLEDIDNLETESSVGELAGLLLNALMVKQREIQLRKETENKANGFYQREFASSLGKLGLSVPRDREGTFRPSFLPDPWSRSDNSFNDFILKLVLQSYSPNKIKSLLKSMNLPYSLEELNEIKEDLYTKSQELKTRQLPDKACAIYIDAYHTDIKDEQTKKVRKAVIYSVIGIDLNGKKELYSYHITEGHETKEDWIYVLNDLISRGLKRVLCVVSDDFSGLKEAISSLYPNSYHQLCFVHLQRNIRKNISKEKYKIFKDELDIIKKQKHFDTAVSMFQELCDKNKKNNISFFESIEKKKNLYFNFLNFPHPIQKFIYTTNTVENFNSRIEVNRVNSGGYFQSKKTMAISIFVINQNLEKSAWKKQNNFFKEAQYEINQLFNLRFEKK